MSLILDGTNGLSDVDGSAATPAIRGTDANTGIFFPAADTIAFAEGGVEAMRLDASGNLLVGTTNGIGKLAISPASGTGSASTWDNTFVTIAPGGTSTSTGLAFSVNTSTNTTQITSLTPGISWRDLKYKASQHIWEAGASQTEAARIDSSGNFTVGFAASPYNSAKMEIYRASAGDALMLTSPVGTGTSNAIAWSNSRGDVVSARIYNVDDGAYGASIVFANRTGQGTTTTERMRIDTSGNLLVGTTSNILTSRLDVYTSTNGTNATFRMDRNTSGADNVAFFHQYAQSTNSAVQCRFYNSSFVSVGTITSSGSATAYNTSSDYRLKNTIAPMTGALAKVAQLKPVTYKWNADGSDGEGFIAHELAEVIPQCVSGAKDAVDEDGNPKYQGIDTSFLVATLTAAIQELKAEFDAYKATHP